MSGGAVCRTASAARGSSGSTPRCPSDLIGRAGLHGPQGTRPQARPAQPQPIVAEYLPSWLAIRRGITDSTRRAHEAHVRLYLISHPGSLHLNEIEQLHITSIWDAIADFLDAARDDRLYPLYYLVARTGLRRGEVCGLHWTDAVIAGRAWTDTELAFTDGHGEALHPAHVTQHFHDLADRAGLPPIRLHDLRQHSYAFTADTYYGDVVPELLTNAAQSIADAIPGHAARNCS